MKTFSRLLALALVASVLTAACSGAVAVLTPGVGTPTEKVSGTPSQQLTSTPGTKLPETPLAGTPLASPSTTGTATVVIPITGDPAEVACSFCVDTVSHLLLVLDQTASYEVVAGPGLTPTVTPPPDAETGCVTVETAHNKQLVLCHGPEGKIVLNICVPGGSENCGQFSFNLQACPTKPAGLTPTATSLASNTPTAGATETPTVGASATPTP